MSLQTNDLRLSVHMNSAVDHDWFHVRVVAQADTLKPLIDALERLHELSEQDWAIYGRYTVGQHLIHCEDGEYAKGKVLWAYGTVKDQPETFSWNLELRSDGAYYLDMNIEKALDEDARLDGTTRMNDKLPVDFWIEPAAFIRSIMGKRGEH
ncbi:hypothetical protein B9J07_27790 [Sinorhizobium sp. LM21]|uniref:hypothetical protein n=1 Tax=Sinorhizobium sp. LM21 TaxID=1449788 RepID=UPI0005D89A96|nr:hypothetical protein [Sinorhizobium sp. LM21]AJW30204.1 hypothetical protein pLM21S1_p84 [Sinorhizobium sp. LM21]OWZ90392.1 hypothetical protein B9J07_27790 [Sinorhizobium sp. LM21]